MSERTRQLKIGIFVLAALGIAAALLFALGIRRGLEKTLAFETYFPRSVSGLLVGSPVTLKGVRVGEVTAIGFSWIEYPGGRPVSVIVHFSVKESLRPAGSADSADLDAAVAGGLRAIIETEGFTGVAHLALEDVEPEKNPPLRYTWKPRTPVIPSAPSQLSQLFSSASTTLNQLEKVDVDRLVNSVDRLLQTADKTLQNLTQFDAKGVSRGLNQTLASASSAALELRALASDTRRAVADMHLDALGRDADALVLAAGETNAKLDRLVDRFSAVDVRQVNETIASARRAAQHLDDAAEELKRYPAGFLFGDAPPRVHALDEER
jgi:phospholipid/cholesterol/gamma-HCH transport system substrate-binding protein